MQIYKYQKVASTQDLAKKYLEGKNSVNAAFLAQEQTAGYGKRGRSFYSPSNTGIYLSIAFPRFKLNLMYAGLLTLAIGVAVVHVLQQQFPSNKFRLKWVNDIYLNDKKVAGILTEKTKFGLVVGIGVNISTTDFPTEISDHVGSIMKENIASDQVSRHLIQAITKATKTYQDSKFLDEYRKLSYLDNKEITLKMGHRKITGQVITIDDQGRIVVAHQGRISSYSSGEVTKVEFEK